MAVTPAGATLPALLPDAALSALLPDATLSALLPDAALSELLPGVTLSALLAGAALGVLLWRPSTSRLDVMSPPATRTPRYRPRRLLSPAALVLAGLTEGPVAAVLAGLLVMAGRRAWGRRQRALAEERERAAAAEILAALGAELRAGRSPVAALEVAARVDEGALGMALAGVATAARLGGDAGAALLRLAEATAIPDMLRGLSACWQVCSATGSSLAAAVDRLSEALRAQEQQRLAVAAELAGPRATAGLLAVLPLAGIGMAAGLGARPLHVLLHTPAGLGCLTAGAGLNALGVWWTGRLVAAAGGAR